jgi:hypothetical protein
LPMLIDHLFQKHVEKNLVCGRLHCTLRCS